MWKDRWFWFSLIMFECAVVYSGALFVAINGEQARGAREARLTPALADAPMFVSVPVPPPPSPWA